MKFAPTQRVRTYCTGDRDNVPAYDCWPPKDASNLCMLGEYAEGFVARGDQHWVGLQQDVVGEYVYLVSFDFGRFLYIQERYLEHV